MRGSKDAMVGSQMGGMEVRFLGGNRSESREKKEERNNHDQEERVEGRDGYVPEWRDGTEHVRSHKGEEAREQRKESREIQARSR